METCPSDIVSIDILNTSPISVCVDLGEIRSSASTTVAIRFLPTQSAFGQLCGYRRQNSIAPALANQLHDYE